MFIIKKSLDYDNLFELEKIENEGFKYKKGSERTGDNKKKGRKQILSSFQCVWNVWSDISS